MKRSCLLCCIFLLHIETLSAKVAFSKGFITLGILILIYVAKIFLKKHPCNVAIKYYVAVEIIYYRLAGYSKSRRGNLFREGATNTQKYFQPLHHYKTFQLTQADPSQPQTEYIAVPNKQFKQCSNSKDYSSFGSPLI